VTGLTALAAQSRDQSAGASSAPVRHYRLPEVADLLGCSLSGVYELIARGDLKAVDMPGRGTSRRGSKRVREDDLVAFQERLRTESARRTA